MKNLINFIATLSVVVIAAVCLPSCRYDDSDLWNEVRDHEDRIAKLEELCSQMNTNISSLQSIVSALQANDYVTSVTPVISGDETIGYTINFSKSGSVTIYHGTGLTLLVGVRKDSDGKYYWTAGGEWLLDDDGNKITADSQDGKPENTPQLKIEDGYWYVSYDNGVTWKELRKATGEDEATFSSVTYDDDFVYLVLADNTKLTIPRQGAEFSITFTTGNEYVCAAGDTVSVPYTLTYGDSLTEVSAIAGGAWSAYVEETDDTSGNIIVIAPTPMEDGEIIVLASDGKEKTIMRKLLFRRGNSNTVAGHEYVDLGLSVKWATCNVGADKPEETGTFFAWGELEPKEDYSEATSKTIYEAMKDISGDENYDAARVQWGATWRIPKKSEIMELTEKCTWEKVTVNGEYGRKVTGPNGNSIFLPTTGYMNRKLLLHPEDEGTYHSATPTSVEDNYYAYALTLDDDTAITLGKYWVVDYVGRQFGRCIRAVTD